MAKETETLREMAVAELVLLHKEETRKLFDLVNENRINKKIDKPHRIRATRKKIARLLTIMGEKQREELA